MLSPRTNDPGLGTFKEWNSIIVDKRAQDMRYFCREVGLAMCHSTGSIGDTLIGPFYIPTRIDC